jgi:transposase
VPLYIDQKKDVLNSFYKALGEEGCKKIEAVASDGARGYLSSTKENARQALIVLDHFHIKKYRNDAVDTVREQELQKHCSLLSPRLST